MRKMMIIQLITVDMESPLKGETSEKLRKIG